MSELPGYNTEPTDRFSPLTAQANAENTRILQQIEDSTAVQGLQSLDQNDGQNMMHYPQGSSGGRHLLRDAIDDAALDAPDSLLLDSIGDQTDTVELSEFSPSAMAILEDEEHILQSISGGLETELSEPRQVLRPNMRYPGFDVDDVTFQNILPTTEQCDTQSKNSEGLAQSAALSKALSEARSKRIASRKEPLSTHSANLEGFNADPDRAESPLDMARIDEHDYPDARELRYVDNDYPSMLSPTSEHSEMDLSSFLQSQETIAANQSKLIQSDPQRRQDRFIQISKIVVNIFKMPAERREKEILRLFTDLGLSSERQESAWEILRRLLAHNKETKNDALPHVFRRWLCVVIHDLQIRGDEARGVATSSFKQANPVGQKGSFCNEGIHKLKCGHDVRSNQDCGMNCVIYSAYPDTPLIDVRMSIIPCNECAGWL